jgi:hypothetical protein
MKRMTLAVVTVVTLFLLLTVGATNALADTWYCGSSSCSATAPSSGTYWTVNDTMATTASTSNSGTFDFTISFTSVAGDPTVDIQDFSGQFFFGSGASVGSLTWVQNPGSWAAPSASKAGNNGSCNGSAPGAFCGAGTGVALSGTSTDTFELTGTYTLGTFLDPNGQYALQFAAANGTGNGNAFAISEDFNPTTHQVPDGGMTVMLLGGALVGLEALRRRVRA